MCFKILQHFQKCSSFRKLAILLFVSSYCCFRVRGIFLFVSLFSRRVSDIFSFRARQLQSLIVGFSKGRSVIVYSLLYVIKGHYC